MENYLGQGEGFKLILDVIAQDARLESEWLNLLSQMEFVGFRKIAKSVPFENIDLSVLQHIAEEASHAYLLKSVSGSEGSWANSRLSATGWSYFQAVDREVSALLTDSEACYPAVSWAIETRVLWVYPKYEKLTRNPKVRSVLSRILAQEKRHGAQFGALPFTESFRRSVLTIEGKLWEQFMSDLRHILSGPELCSLSSSA